MILNQFWRNARREIENQFNTASQITSIQMTLVLNVRRLQKDKFAEQKFLYVKNSEPKNPNL